MVRGEEVLHEALIGLSSEGRPRHSTALLEEVERAVGVIGGWDEVGSIAVGLGPGSFTGVRIAVATALGLVAGTGLPAKGVCTLDAVGLALGELPSSSDRNRLAVLDARRGEVFAALYSPAGERIWAPLVVSPAQLAERIAELPASPLGAGSGAVRFRDELANRGVEIPDDADPVHRVAARHICALVADRDGEPLVPIYLRPPDAERWRERDTSQAAE